MTDTKTEKNNKIPNHIAVIPDGNRRWAHKRGLPTLEGHRKGALNFEKLLDTANELGVKTVTGWFFSTENWGRSDEENKYLFNLARELTKRYRTKVLKEKIRFIHVGRKDRIPQDVAESTANLEEETKDFKGFTAIVAMDYGGHDEILRAIAKMLKDVQDGKISAEDVLKEVGKYQGKYPYYLIRDYLDTKELKHPYPDLVIRTSGEKRTSGFMLWQAAYAEYYFAPECFPDFGPDLLKKAVADFGKRERRFGGDSEK